jgi:uncharacterized protein YbjT (DUF2867 family)
MSQKRTYVVTGATGRTGGIVARGLLEAGHTVRAVGRDAERLQSLVDRGAVPFVGDVRDAAFVERAFLGADAAYLVVPADLAARDVRREFGDNGANYAAAARATGLKSAVFLSTIGTHDEQNRGLVLIHTDVERALDAVDGLNVVHLRAPGFFENLFYFLSPMRERGVLSSPIAPDAPLETVGTRDIGEVALRLLQDLDFRGKSAVELHGEAGLTMRKIAERIGRLLDRPFPVEQADRASNIEAIVAAGRGRDFANLLNDTWELFSRKGLLRAEEPTAASRMPTPIDDFLRAELIPAITAPVYG